MGPAACCRACLSPRVAPLDACADLNYCSGHGVCALGACERHALLAQQVNGLVLSHAMGRRRVRVPARLCGRRLLQ